MSFSLKHVALLCIVAGHSLAATVVCNQPLLNSTDRGAFSVYNQQELADQFTLPATFNIQQVTWYGSFWQTDLTLGVTQYPFVIRFFDSTSASQYAVQTLGDLTTASSTPFYQASVLANATPSAIPFVGTDGGLDAINRTTYEFTTNLDGLTLDPSTEYWISITAEGTTNWRWANSITGSSDYSVYRFVYLNESDWTGFSNAPSNLPLGLFRGDMAFTLSGTEVPEPSTFWGVISAVIFTLLLTQCRWRRKRAPFWASFRVADGPTGASDGGVPPRRVRCQLV